MSRNIAFAVLIAATASCGPQGAPTPSQVQGPIGDNGDYSKLSKQVDALTKEVEKLKEQQSRDDWARYFRELEGVASLHPGDDGYSLVHYDLGVLTVRLSDVTPYANGSKVKIRFGNPLATTVNGLKCTIEWGQVDDKGFVLVDSIKSKDFVLPQELQSGAWTDVSVVLESVKPTQLGLVRIKGVTHSGIRLQH